MNIGRQEDFHHTPEQVGRHIRQAVKLCDSAELTDADRAALLPAIVTLLASKQIFYEQIAPSGIALPQNARH